MPIRLGFAAAALCFVTVCFLGMQQISRSTNSTAAVGYVFLPIAGLIYSLPAFLAGWGLGYVWVRRESKQTLAITTVIVTAILGAWAAKIFWNGSTISQQVRRIETMNASELDEIVSQPDLARDKFVLGAIAQNPNASAAALHRIATMNRPELYERMVSTFDVMGKNTKGLAVMRLVALNPNTNAEDLEHLATSTNDYVLGDVAANAKLSATTLEKLAGRGGYLMEWGLARNPKTSGAVLSNLAEKQDEYTRSFAATNKSATAEVLTVLSKDPIWHVRSSVAQNPSTPQTVIEKLAADPDNRVRALAKTRLENVRALLRQQKVR